MSETAVRAALAALAAGGALLLAIAEFTTLVEVVVGSLETVERRIDGGENHDHALLAVAVAALPLAWLAFLGRRAGAVGVAALGAAALLVALAIDMPDTSASGALPEAEAFADAEARAGAGLYLELGGGALLLASGIGLWLRAAPGTRRRDAA